MEKLNSLYFTAQRKAQDCVDRVKNTLSRKEKGLDQVVIMLLIIAVAAAVIGLAYWIAQRATKQVDTGVNGQISKWFDLGTKHQTDVQ
jgi:flagellar basal body-associated protein FliL